MARRDRKNVRDAIMAASVIAAVVVYYQTSSGVLALNIAIGGLLLSLVAYIFYSPIAGTIGLIRKAIQKVRLKRIARSNKVVNAMTWAEFEYYVAEWLRRRGYTNVHITEKYDLGVDIVAKKDGLTWGVQVKHSQGLVGINAVRQVVVALKKYKCDRAMVVTNSLFSRPAIELAESQDCILIDGSKL